MMAIQKLLSSSLQSSFKLWLKIIKIMIPISIAVKILIVFGVIDYFGKALSPIMMLVGLPGLLGIVWAVTVATNLWSGALIFISISSLVTLTTAQVTILGTLMLLAHSLPLELKMVSKCGISAIFSFCLRIISALFLAYLLHYIFQHFHILNTPANLLLHETAQSNWLVDQVKSYLTVFTMIACLVLFMDILKHYGLIQYLGTIFAPYLVIMGLSKKAAPVTLVGMTLGLIYGGALLLKEVEAGEINAHDKTISITSMNLFHSIIEDTIIIVLMGGAVFWLILPRLVWTVVVIRVVILFIGINKELTYKIIRNQI